MVRTRILFIAPLPPPIHGQSVASEAFLCALKLEAENTVRVVNTAGPRRTGALSSLRRIFWVIWLQILIFAYACRSDRIYLTTSETVGGNLKDLLTFVICFLKLHRMFLHLHGGAGMRLLMSPAHRFLHAINRFFLRRMGGVIVLGQSLREIFEAAVPPSRLHVVHNFAHEEFALEVGQVEAKFQRRDRWRLLYLSNMIPSKGFRHVLEGFLALPESIREGFQLDFAGAFQDPADESEFRSSIAGQSNIAYHGVVRGELKRKLLQEAHLFFLPTYYPYEGQPISILEAYAAGCVVVTTDHSGIPDIFADGSNGIQVPKRSSEAISRLLCRVAEEPPALMPMAVRNSQTFQDRYRVDRYNASLARVLGVSVSTRS